MDKKEVASHRIKIDERVKSRHSREGGNPEVRNFLKRMDSRLRTSGMTAMKRTFYDGVKIVYVIPACRESFFKRRIPDKPE